MPTSINEPHTPALEGGIEAKETAPGPLVLVTLEPDHVAISASKLFLTVIGEGFDKTCIVVFDDDELPTTFVDETTLTCSPPMATAADTVDVEVHRGEEMSDVLLFEFASSTAARVIKEPTRKPKKAEPVHKRAKKGQR